MNYALVLVFLGAVAFLAAVSMLFYQQYRERSFGAVSKRDDLASMMILLQTMRDLLEQQKSFARELNKALDTRVEFIKQTVQAARAEMTSMSDSIKQLKGDIERIQRDAQATAVRQPAPPAHPPNVRQLSAYTPVPTDPAPPKEHERPALRVLAMPREPETTGDPIDSWVGLDFGGDEPEPLDFDVPETQPDMPHDATAARSAFRALLDLAPEQQAQKNTIMPAPSMGPAVTNERPISPLHARVYEYNDAGMNVAQIAQELGIGKGEVRLILSLRKGKGG